MMNKEKEIKLQSIVQNDESIAAELENAESITAVCTVFATRGLELSEEEASEMMAKAIAPVEEGELDENVLSSVAGGITWKQVQQAFRLGARAGIIARMAYDKYKYGDATRTYSYAQLASGKFW